VEETVKLNATSVDSPRISSTTGNYAGAMRFLTDTRGFVLGTREVNLESVQVHVAWKMNAGSNHPLLIQVYSPSVEERTVDVMPNKKKDAFVAPTWLINLSPFILLALTILGLAIALKTLPSSLANSLYSYFAVFKI
jgi:hypothetical protein